MSPQKPMRRAYEQSDEAVRWLDERYPQIENAGRRDRAEILRLDESGQFAAIILSPRPYRTDMLHR